MLIELTFRRNDRWDRPLFSNSQHRTNPVGAEIERGIKDSDFEE
jgi:hypothetical protein